MKKIITIMLIVLGTVASARERFPHNFIVEGEFLEDKNIDYTIFKETKKGDFVAIEHLKSRKYFFIACDPGSKYIVRFQNKKGNVKFLMIDAVKKGHFMVDVDWSKPTDGKITLEKSGYALKPFTNTTKLEPLAQN